MTRLRSTLPALRMSIAAALVVCLASACVWDGYIPGEKSWNPDIVVGPGDLSESLVLDAPYVGRLECFANPCEKRFRVIVDEPGQLTLTGVPTLGSNDARMWMVLEAPTGPMARTGTGAGPHEDVPILAITKPVDRGTYYVLMQSVGGPIPYQLRAHWTPGGPKPAERAPQEPEPALEAAAPADLKLVALDLPGGASGGYDPAVPFAELHTFVFRAPADGDAAPGTSLGTPLDREVRRLIAETLTFRGLRQADAREPADLVVDFAQSSRNLTYRELSPFYDRYSFIPIGFGSPDVVAQRGTLIVEIIDAHTSRIAWHAWTTQPIGPGTATGQGSFDLARKAVGEVLAGFPPP
jgi:hypothetical protein